MVEQGNKEDKGKVRHDLLDAYAIDQLARVLTFGADGGKYGDHNWRGGLKWSRVIASMKRHINAIERGEDYDSESGLLHSSHVMCNAMFLTNYYKTFPQGDDRPLQLYHSMKIGLDIDEVLGDFVQALRDRIHIDIPQFWNLGQEAVEELDRVKEDKDFWLNIPVKTRPEDIPFEPHCYITARSIPPEWTREWLTLRGFPNSPLYSVGFGQSKVDVAKESGIDIFVDDRFETFVELNRAGICCFLYDAPHNKRYNVGYKRIKTLKQLS